MAEVVNDQFLIAMKNYLNYSTLSKVRVSPFALGLGVCELYDYEKHLSQRISTV